MTEPAEIESENLNEAFLLNKSLGEIVDEISAEEESRLLDEISENGIDSDEENLDQGSDNKPLLVKIIRNVRVTESSKKRKLNDQGSTSSFRFYFKETIANST